MPTLRAVAAGLPARTGFTPASALVEHERERVEVGALVDLLARGLLGGHVGDRADHVARAGERRVARQVGDPEVGQLGRRAGGTRLVGDDHVLRLHVAVDDPALVRVLERVGEREAGAQDVAVRQLAGGGEAVERAPADELGHQVARVAVLARVEHADDPGVVEPRGGERLARRPFRGGRAHRDDLHRHGPVQALVVGGVDGAEAARAEARAQAVAAEDDGCAGTRGGGRELLRGVHRSLVRRARRLPCRLVAAASGRRAGHTSRPTVSFFEEDDEPRRTPRPRRAAAGGVGTDNQTLLVRRAIAGVVVVVFVLALVFLVRSCQTSAKENALKDYNREVAAIGGESARQVGTEFFRLLGQGGDESPQDLQTAISGFRVQAEQQLKQAQGLDVPGEMEGAQESLLIALEWRRDGLDYIAQRIRTALGDSGDAADRAIQEIAGQMQVFLASDVAYRTRVVPFIDAALKKEEIGAQQIPQSQFLPDLRWLQPDVVAQQVGQQLSAGAGRNRNEPTGPGLHGTNIDSVSYGDTTLEPDAANQLAYDPDTAFAVKFTNGGDNDEFDVKVTVRIQGPSGDPITLTDTDRPDRPEGLPPRPTSRSRRRRPSVPR